MIHDLSQSNATIIECVDGITMMFLEGQRSREEAKRIIGEIERHIQRAIVKGGTQHLLMAIPPELRLTCARGNRIEMDRTADNRIRMQVMANRAGKGILIPGRDFRLP